VGSRAADALSLASRLLEEGARALRARVRPGADALPGRPGEVTAAWLSSVLGVRVTGFRLSGEEAGTTARARLALQAGEGAPRALFLKLAPPDLPTRLFVGLMGLAEREVRFYRELAAALPVRVPRCHHAVSCPRSGRFALLLDDLAEGGATFRDITRPCDVEEAAAVVVELARLHALLWRSPRFDAELAWLGAPRSGSAFRVERFVTERLVAAGLRRQGAALPEAQRRLGSRLPRLRAALEAEWSRAPTALLHGDPHLGNLWFDAQGPGFLDWQVVRGGDPFRDLVYFLVLSLSVETRRARERELLRLYLEALEKEGVREIGFEEAWRRLRVAALYTWIAAVATAGAATLQAAPIVAAGLQRAGAAVQDLDPVHALSPRA
jgi:aminoglycoside phosphotransferase (APT) family kinase protein